MTAREARSWGFVLLGFSVFLAALLVAASFIWSASDCSQMGGYWTPQRGCRTATGKPIPH